MFHRIAPELVVVKPLEAEFAKLFSNAYRYIEFAATNQFYMIAKSAGADYQAIMQAMKHNYPRLKSLPRPGFAAGPCLFKDTMQLAAFARNQFGLGHAAMQVNEGLVLQLVDDLRRAYDISNMTVGLLGMAFKAEIDDTRASLSYKLKRTLQMFAREVLTTDPFVTTDPTLLPFDEVVDAQRHADPVHAAFRLCGCRPRWKAGGGRVGLSQERECRVPEHDAAARYRHPGLQRGKHHPGDAGRAAPAGHDAVAHPHLLRSAPTTTRSRRSRPIRSASRV